METPTTNVTVAAIKLMRFKMLIQIGKGLSYPSLDINDINEILTVAGLPVIVPAEVKAPELKIIKTTQEKTEAETECDEI